MAKINGHIMSDFLFFLLRYIFYNCFTIIDIVIFIVQVIAFHIHDHTHSDGLIIWRKFRDRHYIALIIMELLLQLLFLPWLFIFIRLFFKLVFFWLTKFIFHLSLAKLLFDLRQALIVLGHVRHFLDSNNLLVFIG